eukprot:CAMPEP_0197826118 /NCGR_PEP_ID=MMETSP1437-20131217/3107_1 /TAXON_ID=49252 ORGANISM="Eucampia antarctica, Strain CCMP1452" /NCGR_SAMPLE_ID=MMETSP1437 /ASSEMBLY_ACC=CAM_ASM_001096 /LENGTH=176 /DNA_ID=CAMNT_0043426401 /DNA_START=23 /DNA_END=553 /DNA_ORIENTATION=+
MALRHLASKTRAFSQSNNLVVSLTKRSFSADAVVKSENRTFSVKDVTISLNIVDPSGARRQVPGLIGKSIYETCQMHNIDLGPVSVGGAVEEIRSDTWTEPLYGEGPTAGYDHVLLNGNGTETAKPMTHVEANMLDHYWDEDEIFPESRLASQVLLTKQMDGMIVYVPDRLVDDIP